MGFSDYSLGLMLPIERKSVEPLAAHIDPGHVSAKHQSLHHLVADSEPTKYWLSTLPAKTMLVNLVKTAKMRWRIERDYQDLKPGVRPEPLRGTGLARF
jgi:SRSO17 transposase